MPYIYRVENQNLAGPYQGDEDICCELRGTHDNTNGHPSPSFDRGIQRRPLTDEICGFATVTQFKKWFSKQERRALYNTGYKLKRVQVEEVTAVGETQVLAIR